MRNLIVVVIIGMAALSAAAQSNKLQEIYNAGQKAYQQRDLPTFYARMKEALSIHPYHQIILYNAGIGAALNNELDQALDFLNRAVLIKADLDLAHPDLTSLAHLPAFDSLRTAQKVLMTTLTRSDTAFVLADRELHMESITTGEEPGVFYGASIHKRKIIRIAKGIATDFTTTGQDGLSAVFSVKYDQRRQLVWASASPMKEMQNYDSSLSAGVFAFHAKTGNLAYKFHPAEGEGHVLGDLLLAPDGHVYVTDSKNNFIFRVDEATGTLEKFFSSPEFINLQGLTTNTNGSAIYVADYVRGVFMLDPRTRDLVYLAPSKSASMKGIDGLMFFRNSLIAIQNGVVPMRVTRFSLDRDGRAITGHETLDRGVPVYDEPTNGCIHDGTLYYIGNSTWNAYDAQHQMKPHHELHDIIVLRQALR